jgi:peroxiredoxin
MITAGEMFPELTLDSITGEKVVIPDPGGRLTHLQLRRFAGCPSCTLHLRSVVQRRDEIEAAGIREVVVFHSTKEELLTYQDELPFAVIADPARELYRRFGVEHRPRALLDRRTVRILAKAELAMTRKAVKHRKMPIPPRPTGGLLGLPADFLIDPAGTVVAAKYGEHAYDQWTVGELLANAPLHHQFIPEQSAS